MDRLQKIAEDFKTKHGRDLICSLIFDEMHIRQQILFSLEKMDYVGYADLQKCENEENDEKKVAKQAIAFLLNGIPSVLLFHT